MNYNQRLCYLELVADEIWMKTFTMKADVVNT